MKKSDHDLVDDFQEFLTAEVQPRSLPPKLPTCVRSQLVKSPRRFALIYLIISIAGYILSLSVCAQHNIGLFIISHTIANLLARLPEILCAITCGVIFTAVPTVLVRMCISSFQQRFLFSRLAWEALGVPTAAIAILGLIRTMQSGTSHHHYSQREGLSDPAWMALWVFGAAMPPLIAYLIAKAQVATKSNSSSSKDKK